VADLSFLAKTDPTIDLIISKELGRQRSNIELIASENFTSAAVMQAQGTVLTNKYAEGLPGKRYYGGCVQPHSGANANLAVFLALLKPGDLIMGMDLSHGGHLTHGSPVNISGMWLNKVHYGVSPTTEQLDYDLIRDLAVQHKPKLLICGFSAYSRIIHFDKFRAIADEIGAFLMADIAHIAGLVATGHHPSPIAYCDVVTTTTHKTLRGPRGGLILSRDLEMGKKFDKAVFPGTQGGPLEHVIAGKAVAFGEALQPEFKTYSGQVIANAKALGDQLQQRGFKLVSNGTDNHLILVDLRSIGMTGKLADQLVSGVNITANKNTVPFDPESPFVTSGLRLGSPAMTTRGLDVTEFTEIADIIADRLLNPEDRSVQANCQSRVASLCDRFPLYADLYPQPKVLAAV
jgi:glycine hydroxymethyltransferase